MAIAVIACIALVAMWLISRSGDETPAGPLAGTNQLAGAIFLQPCQKWGAWHHRCETCN